MYNWGTMYLADLKLALGLVTPSYTWMKCKKPHDMMLAKDLGQTIICREKKAGDLV